MKKKLQVFISSTYTDLIDERQAAVQAVLDAGHIPAGMELFKAGNSSQLKTIYKWIDESDVYMLILGGRYGSIESKSGKSYTQLEYEYALSKNIPVFAVVLNQDFLTKKITKQQLVNVMEQDNPQKFNDFKTLVMSKIIKEVEDCKDIKIEVHATLSDFLDEYELQGWTRGNNETDALQLIKDNNMLIKENNSLNKQIQKLQVQLSEKSKECFGNYTFDELIDIFKKKKFTLPEYIAKSDKEVSLNALDIFIVFHNTFVTGVSNRYDSSKQDGYLFYNIAPYYVSFNFLETVKLTGTTAQRIQTTKQGASFYALLESRGMTS